MDNNNIISVIGGLGFIGSRLQLILNNHSFKVLDKDKSRNNELYNYCDITDYNSINKGLKGSKVVVFLAAEHRDNVSPTSLYYEVNVAGAINVVRALKNNKINRILYTSTAGVYGLNQSFPREDAELYPFNDYSKSKLDAEKVLIEWWSEDKDNRELIILRPTVVFGENNRGNVYNLINQITKKRFIMVGNGQNKKSMAYVGNVVAFIKFLIENPSKGMSIYNYADSPDLNMNELVKLIQNELGIVKKGLRIPQWLGLVIGHLFDFLALLLNKNFSVSAVRIKKFCADTTFDTQKLVLLTDFKAPYTLKEGLKSTIQNEFINQKK